MNDTITRKWKRNEKKTSDWVINLALKYCSLINSPKGRLVKKLGTQKQGTTTVNLLLINIIAGKWPHKRQYRTKYLTH